MEEKIYRKQVQLCANSAHAESHLRQPFEHAAGLLPIGANIAVTDAALRQCRVDDQVFKGGLSRSGTSGDDGVSFRYFAASELRDLFTGKNRGTSTILVSDGQYAC